MSSTPFEIIKSLFPTLIQSAHYSKLIQERVHALDDKENSNNIFAAALSDADVSIQTHIELAILSNFPTVPFFGEEWKSSRNTKYLSGTCFTENEPYLITLDPIDGTRIYLDGGELFQIILTVVSRDTFEAAIALFPRYNQYVYAIRGHGAYSGTLDTPIENATPHSIDVPDNAVYISGEFANLLPKLTPSFTQVTCPAKYSKERTEPYPGAILRGGLRGMMLVESQIIDGAALAFISQEIGFQVQTFEGGPIPRPEEYRDLVLPGLIIGRNRETLDILIASRR